MDNGAESYRRYRENGDESGLIEIIRDYKDGLILFLSSIVGDVHTAEDLAEDTFVLIGTKKPKDALFHSIPGALLQHSSGQYKKKRILKNRIEIKQMGIIVKRYFQNSMKKC